MAAKFDRFEYSPIIDRPIIKWPNNARVAFWVSPNVEHYEYLPPPQKVQNPWPRTPHPDVQGYCYREYGNRIGFWRMLEVTDRYDLKCTISLNAAVLDHFPEICDAMVKRDWTYMSHGVYNTRYMTGMTEAEEREFYQDTIDTVKRHTGKRLKGMLGPSVTGTEHTPDLMAEAGFSYHADWFHDDQPFPLHVKKGKLISVPYSIEVNDAPFFIRGYEGDAFFQMCKDQFDTLYAEGAQSGRVMCIALHPLLIGQPHRVKYLDKILEYILSHSGVWQTTADEIADYYIANYYDEVLRHVAQQKTVLPAR